nr:uncharacterized protein LOC117227163 [Megalopta genalis]
MSFHEFNPFTGRLKQSTKVQPLYPVNPRPLQSIEIDIMYDSIKTKPVKTTAPGTAGYSTLDPKLAKLYRKYQANLETYSYTLGGRKDRILVAATVLLTVTGFAANVYNLIKLQSK